MRRAISWTIADLVYRERATQEGRFAVGEPLLDDLIAADGVLPDADGDVGPIGGVVKIDIARFVSEMGESLFL